jgi:hypothetical protein
MTAKMFYSFRDLRASLGRIDAAFAYVALCVMHFDRCANSSGSRSKYITEQAEEYSIKVFLANDTLPREHVFFSCCVGVHSEWDRFLYKLMDELPSFHYPEVNQGERLSGEPRLAFFLRKMEYSEKLSNLSQLLMNMCEYLRLVRNYYVHRLGAPRKECIRLFDRIQRNREDWPSHFGNLSLSANCCEVAFDDVIVFTIAVKRLAEEICNSLAPDVSDLLAHPDTKSFLKRKDKAVSKKNLQQFLLDRFGLDRDTAEKLANVFAAGALV